MVSFNRKAIFAAPAFALLVIYGSNTGKFHLRRLAVNCIHNVYASEGDVLRIPHIPASTNNNIPAYIALCQKWIEKSGDRRSLDDSSDKSNILEQHDTCVDWSSPHSAMMDITSALIVTRFMPDVKYRHNCDRTRVYDEAALGFDHSTIQQVISTPSLGLDDGILTEDMVKNHCRRSLLYFDPNVESTRAKCKAHHHPFAWAPDIERNRDATSIPEFPVGDSVTPLSMVIKPLTQRYYHAAMDWRDVTDKPPKEEESGVVIYVDQSTLGIDYETYLPHIPVGSTSISVLGGPLCGSTNLKTGQLCHDYATGLSNFLQQKFPGLSGNGFNKEHGCSYKISASTAAISSRLALSQVTICPPHTTNCYLPALSRTSGSSVVLEDPNWGKAIDFFSVTGTHGKVRVVELDQSVIPSLNIQAPPNDDKFKDAAKEFSLCNSLVDDEGYPINIQVPPMPNRATVLNTPDSFVCDRINRKIGEFKLNPAVKKVHPLIVPSLADIEDCMKKQVPLTQNVKLNKNGWKFSGRNGELSVDHECGYGKVRADEGYLKQQDNYRFDSINRIQHDFSEQSYNLVKTNRDNSQGSDLSSAFEIKCPETSEYQNGNVVTNIGNVQFSSGQSGTMSVNQDTQAKSDEDTTNLPNGVPFREGDGYKIGTAFGFTVKKNEYDDNRRRRMVAVDAKSFKFGENLHRICREHAQSQTAATAAAASTTKK